MIDNISFSKSFLFRLLTFHCQKHTDNSKKGISLHFIARMRHGQARICALSGEDFTLSAGDVFYLPKGLRYESFWFPDEESGIVEWESYGFEVFPNPNQLRFCAQRLFPSDEALSCLDRLAEINAVTAETVGKLYLFLGDTLPTMEQTDADPRRILFEKIRAYVEEHSDLRVPLLAKHCRMSESGLYAFTRDYAGLSPVELKNQILSQKAAELLRSTDLSIEEISDRLGFCTSAYFRKIFKEQFGKTPTALRKEAHLI